MGAHGGFHGSSIGTPCHFVQHVSNWTRVFVDIWIRIQLTSPRVIKANTPHIEVLDQIRGLLVPGL